MGFHCVKILGQQVGTEIRWHAVFGEQLEVLGEFIRPELDTTHILTQIGAIILIPQDREFRQPLCAPLFQQRHGFGRPILVNNRNAGQIQPHSARVFAGIVAGGKDQMLTGDLTLIGGHLPMAVIQLFISLSLGVLIHRRPGIPGQLGQRHGDIGGVHIAVLGMQDAAANMLGLVQQRMDFRDLFGRHQPARHARGLGDRDIGLELIPPLFGVGDPQLPNFAQPDRAAHLLFDLGVNADRLHRHLRDIVRAHEGHQQPRRMPCRARSQRRAFQHHGIRTAMFRQPVKDRGADTAAPDNHNLCMRLHLRVLLISAGFPTGTRPGLGLRGNRNKIHFGLLDLMLLSACALHGCTHQHIQDKEICPTVPMICPP